MSRRRIPSKYTRARTGHPARVLLLVGTIMKVPSLTERIRGEFREMPGMQLTITQAQRLFGLDAAACRHVIDALVEASFLRWTPSGTIVQAGE
jgi:hypothetical protein